MQKVANGNIGVSKYGLKTRIKQLRVDLIATGKYTTAELDRLMNAIDVEHKDKGRMEVLMRQRNELEKRVRAIRALAQKANGDDGARTQGVQPGVGGGSQDRRVLDDREFQDLRRHDPARSDTEREIVTGDAGARS